MREASDSASAELTQARLQGIGPAGTSDVSGVVDRWVWTREPHRRSRQWVLVATWSTVTGFSFSDIALSPDGKRLAYGLADGTGGIWGFPTNNGFGGAEEFYALEGQTAEVNTIEFSPSGNNVADADDDGTARIYFSGTPWLTSVSTPMEPCGDSSFKANDQFAWQGDDLVAIVESGSDTVVKKWSVPNGHLLPGSTLLSTDGAKTCASLSPDGRLAAVWSDPTPTAKTKVKVIDVASQRVLLTLPAMTVDGVVISADDRLLVVNDGKGGLHTTTLSNGRTTVTHGWPTSCAEGALWRL